MLKNTASKVLHRHKLKIKLKTSQHAREFVYEIDASAYDLN